MFDAVRNNKMIAKVILALIAVPFALFGVDYYFRGGAGANVVATVGGQDISQQDFARALRTQQDEMRNALGAQYDPTMFDNPEARMAVLENIVNDRLLAGRAAKVGLAVPEKVLAEAIATVPAFQKDGRFSREQYEQLLRAQGMTAVQFQARVQHDFVLQQLRDPYQQTGFVSAAVAERLVQASEQEREVSRMELAADAFLSQAKIDDAELKAYFDGHPKEFAVPEQVKVEYLELSVDAVAPTVAVTPEETKAYYDQNASRYRQEEERDVSHILVRLPAGADPERKAVLKQRAADLLARVNKDPSRFADVARESSEDPGSAPLGGELGPVTKGATVPAFEQAVFSMAEGEIRGPVESEFGFHVIRLNGIKAGKEKSLDEVRTAVEAEVRKQKAARKLTELADQFGNLVYEQPDSLKPAATALGLKVQESDWISRGKPGAGVFANEKLVNALFTDSVLKEKRNSEAVEVATNVLVAARVKEHKPATSKKFEDVAASLRERLTKEKAGQLAIKAGEEKLALLREGKDAGVEWGPPVPITRGNAAGLSAPAQEAVFRIDAAKLPAYGGAARGTSGFTLLKLTQVRQPSQVEASKRKALAQQLRELALEAELVAYLNSLKQRVEVKVERDKLENKPL